MRAENQIGAYKYETGLVRKEIKFSDDGRVTVIVMPPKIKNVVFEGGGARGLVYVGAIDSLTRQGLMPGIERVAGSSAGAVTAMLLSFNCTAEEIFTYSQKIDLNDLKRNKRTESGTNLFRAFSHFLSPFLTKRLSNASQKKAIEFSQITANIFFSKKGMHLYDGEAVYHILKTMVAGIINKLKDKLDEEKSRDEFLEGIRIDRITFKDLKMISQRYPELGIKDLIVTGTNLTKKEIEYFSFEHTPDMEIAKAVQISMSIPIFFQSVTYNDQEYVDGGCLNNFPVSAFDNPNVQYQNLETLGFRVDTRAEMGLLWGQKNTTGFFSRAPDHVTGLNISNAELKNLKQTRESFAQRTIQIYDQGVGMVQFHLTEETKKALIMSGKKSTETWLKNHEDECLSIDTYPSFLDYIDSLPIDEISMLNESLLMSRDPGKLPHAVEALMVDYLDFKIKDHENLELKNTLTQRFNELFQTLKPSPPK